MKYIGPTFLQDCCSSTDQTIFIKALKGTEQGGNEILHEMVDDPSMAQNLKILVHHDHGLADVKNKDEKKAMNLAKSECMEAMKEGLYLFREFEVIDDPLLHSSRTACVFKVNRFEQQDPVAVNNNKRNHKSLIPMALKCMNKIEQVCSIKTNWLLFTRTMHYVCNHLSNGNRLSNTYELSCYHYILII